MIKYVPNILTLVRILASLLLVVCYVIAEDITIAIALIFIAASITDKLDGDIARKYNLISKAGKLLDPIADKLLLMVVLLILVDEQLLPMWGLVFVVVKEGLITLYRLDKLRKGVVLSASHLGKKKVAYNFLVVAIVFLVCALGHGAMLYEQDVFKWWILTILL